MAYTLQPVFAHLGTLAWIWLSSELSLWAQGVVNDGDDDFMAWRQYVNPRHRHRLFGGRFFLYTGRR